MIRRRQFILLLIFLTTMLSIGLAVTRSFTAFLAINFFVGFGTVTPQVLIPLAADLSPPKRRAQSMAIVLSGLLLGILYARVLAGIIAEYVSWRNVYYMAIGTQGLVWISLYCSLPDYPPKNPDLKYWQVFPTMIKFICTNPVLGRFCYNLAWNPAKVRGSCSSRQHHKRYRKCQFHLFLGHTHFPTLGRSVQFLYACNWALWSSRNSSRLHCAILRQACGQAGAVGGGRIGQLLAHHSKCAPDSGSKGKHRSRGHCDPIPRHRSAAAAGEATSIGSSNDLLMCAIGIESVTNLQH